jgi:hypothetical protein
MSRIAILTIRIVLLVVIISVLSIGGLLWLEQANAALNDYGRVPNKVATYYGANGGPARNNSHGYLWGK